MKRRKINGFSVLEVISALVILAVVAAAAAATISPIQSGVDQKQAEQEIAWLNDLSQSFLAAEGHLPVNVHDLVRKGYLPETDPDAAERVRRIRRNYRYSNQNGKFSQR